MTDMILEVKNSVTREIDKKLNTDCIPETITEFLKGPWREVMKIIGLRYGYGGRSWRAAVRLMDDLIWSVQPKTMAHERRHLLALIPRILLALREGLLLIGYEPEEINNFLKQLEKIHISCIRAIGFKEKPVVPTANNQKPATDILHEIAKQSDKHRAFQSDIADPALSGSPCFHTVKSMPLGTWVEFKDHQGAKRGKLAWKCDFTGEFTFMDRMYKVIADVSMKDLIREFEYGKAYIVSEVPLLERAVDVFVNGMKFYSGRDSTTVQLARQ
ncbi:DUF1631 family protein [Kaarinaea lacus]